VAGTDNLVRLDRLLTLEVRVRLPGVSSRPVCGNRHHAAPGASAGLGISSPTCQPFGSFNLGLVVKQGLVQSKNFAIHASASRARQASFFWSQPSAASSAPSCHMNTSRSQSPASRAALGGASVSSSRMMLRGPVVERRDGHDVFDWQEICERAAQRTPVFPGS
jgi:hypothetical protein